MKNNFFFQRLFKNKGTVYSIIVIILAVLTAIFAYLIAPDATPYANRMIPGIANQKPGFRSFFLKVKREKPVEKQNLFHRIIYGQEDEFLFIPINSYTAKKDSIVVEKFIDEGIYGNDGISIVANRFITGNGKKIPIRNRQVWQRYPQPVACGRTGKFKCRNGSCIHIAYTRDIPGCDSRIF